MAPAVFASGESAGPVGFVMVSWNCEPQPPEIIGPWFLWKLLIDERFQGRGYGAAVVRQVAGLVRAEGTVELLTSLYRGRWARWVLPAARVRADRRAR